MTKRELTKWLVGKENHAIIEIDKVYKEARQKVLDERFQALGFDIVAEQIQSHLTEAVKLWDNWKNGLTDDSHISFRGSFYSLEHMLDNFICEPGATYERLTNAEMGLDSGKLLDLYKENKRTHEKILKTYADVRAVVLSLNTVKEAQAYLKELGFDLTELEKEQQPVTALAVKIDTSYLFLGKAA